MVYYKYTIDTEKENLNDTLERLRNCDEYTDISEIVETTYYGKPELQGIESAEICETCGTVLNRYIIPSGIYITEKLICNVCDK